MLAKKEAIRHLLISIRGWRAALEVATSIQRFLTREEQAGFEMCGSCSSHNKEGLEAEQVKKEQEVDLKMSVGDVFLRNVRTEI